MNSRTRNILAQFITAVLLLASAVSPAACGGGTPATGAQQNERAEVSTPSPLFDERGRPLAAPSSAVPADTAARTRPGLYATRAQYEREELTSYLTTILLDVDALGTAEMTAMHAQQARGYRDGQALTYFVQARQPTAAAEVVNRLVDDGFAPVFMIVR